MTTETVTVAQHPNVTAAIAAFTALVQGDPGPGNALMTDDFAMVNHDNGAGDRHLIEGREAFWAFMGSWAAFFEGTFAQEPLGIYGGEDHVVMLVRETGRHGDAVFDNQAVYVIHVRDGRWTRLETYDRDREANAAFWAQVGVSAPPM
jgi:ketosteroid isomerase-like protein